MRVDRGIVVVEEGGSVTLPPHFLADLGWQPGDDLTIEMIENGFTIERATPDTA